MDIIDTTKLSLSEFLKLLSSNKEFYYPKYHFPTKEMVDEFLAGIAGYSIAEVKGILRKFIIKNCTFGLDQPYIDHFQNTKEPVLEALEQTEYYRRLMSIRNANDCLWEGLTWVLDLLPDSPDMATKVISSYYIANCQFLPDDQLIALEECLSIIRAKFINVIPIRDQLLELNPLEFEMIVAKLYSKLKYEVELTKRSYDGGIDVLCDKKEIGKKERLVIQCKRYKYKVGVKDIRELLGVVSHKKATKGTIISTGYFTREAIKFAHNNPRIELINYDEFARLCNMHLGSQWENRIGNIILEYKKGKK
ncbi:MAG: restriction endonuclease [Flavobacterium sp.]|nr:MAG: restriction endonuclease [Flavobacterium sp.]